MDDQDYLGVKGQFHMNQADMYRREDYLGPRAEREEFQRTAAVQHQRSHSRRTRSRWAHVGFLLAMLGFFVLAYLCWQAHTFLMGWISFPLECFGGLMFILFLSSAPKSKG